MENKAFIFTMDAALGLIPVFIVLATLSQISYSGSLFSQSFMIGGERIANDVLRVLDLKGVLNETNSTVMNITLNNFIPSEYNFRYRLIYNDSAICNASRGNISEATDIAVALRNVQIKIYGVLGSVLEISHFGSDITSSCCTAGGGRRHFNASFYVNPGEKSIYTYWLVGVLDSPTVTNRYGISPFDSSSCSCTGSPPPNDPGQPPFTVEITSMITDGATNTLNLRLEGSGRASYWIIRAPLNPPLAQITPENAQVYSQAAAKLEVWPR